jgi:hypothetical protein
VRLLRRSPRPGPEEERAAAAEPELGEEAGPGAEPAPGAADGAHADPPTVELDALGGEEPAEGADADGRAGVFASAPANGAGPGEHALAAVPYGEPPLWERPEVALAAAFCAGLLAAVIFKRR